MTKTMYFLPPGSMTLESAVPATDEQIMAGKNLYVVSGGFTIDSVVPASPEEISRARKNPKSHS